MPERDASESGRRARHQAALLVALAGLVVTVVIAAAGWVAHDRNEDRLLTQRTREAAAVLGNSGASVQAPFAAAAVVAQATNGDPGPFRTLMEPLIASGSYASISLWRLDASGPRQLVALGAAPELATSTDEARSALERAAAKGGLTTIDLLDRAERRLGYAVPAPGDDVRYLTYAEVSLPEGRAQPVEEDNAFHGLDYVLYLGDREDARGVLLTSITEPRLEGRRDQQLIPFGDGQLLLVMAPRGNLGGTLMAALPWMAIVLGGALTAVATATTVSLGTRRRDAERLALENRSLYDNQRAIALTLQRSLLPVGLPDVPGLELQARYEAGVQGMEIGGDWYDVIELDDRQLIVVVGDVSGRGVRAAAAMAALRFATRAYAHEGHSPATILTKLGDTLDASRDGHFATMLCAHVDVDRRVISIANAGHPNPVLVEDGARLLETRPGVPIGVRRATDYPTVVVEVAPGATLLAFTDGLFERRGENIDLGMERVRQAAERAAGWAPNDTPRPDGRSLDDLLDSVLDQMTGRSEDDTALIGVRWRA